MLRIGTSSILGFVLIKELQLIIMLFSSGKIERQGGEVTEDSGHSEVDRTNNTNDYNQRGIN